MKYTALNDQDWHYLAAGPAEDQWNILLRLNPISKRARGHGVRIAATGLTHFFHGAQWFIDDGELTLASRTLEAHYLAEKKREEARQAILAGGKLPPIDAAQWINTDAPLDWDKLEGKVVLLDFWGTWCGPCVSKLPRLQPLHEKYADRGLVIIAIHSAQAAETCEAFVRENSYTFPVAVDTGKTAEAYAISGWPTYFLIDRSGKVAQSFTHDTPTEEAIEKLLGADAEE